MVLHQNIHLPHPASWSPFRSCSLSNWTTVYRARLPQHSPLLNHPALSFPGSPNPARLVAVKQVSSHLNRPPHDTQAEIKTLSSLSHPNIVPLLAHLEPPGHPCYCLFLPLYPTTLHTILNSPKPIFMPAASPASYTLARRILRSLASGLAFLHGQAIAHRDLAPANVALCPDGTAVLIDFGTVWDPRHPRATDKLEFELGTMPYRAPELLFGSRSYTPTAIDLWALGALLAELFLPLEPASRSASPAPNPRPQSPDSAPSDDLTWAGESALSWYAAPAPLSPTEPWMAPEPECSSRAKPMVRKTLFQGDVGDIGLVGSIFRIRGTPNHLTWPESRSLPDFSKLEFHQFERQYLGDLLQISGGEEGRDTVDGVPKEEQDEIVDLVDRLLVYEAKERLEAQEVLEHKWVKRGEDEEACREAMKAWIGSWEKSSSLKTTI